jgi:hypothetical protein
VSQYTCAHYKFPSQLYSVLAAQKQTKTIREVE